MNKNFIFAGATGWRTTAASSLFMAMAALGCGDVPDQRAPESFDGETDLSVEGGATQAQQSAGSSAQWCAVKQIMDKSCVGCHDGKGTAGTPMGLTQAADFAKSAPVSTTQKVYQAVASRMRNTQRPMPPRGVLPEADLKAVDAWVAAGAPIGNDPTCKATTAGGSTTVPGGPKQNPWPPPGCDEVYELRSRGPGGASVPYQVGLGETHPQIAIDPPWGATKVQAIAFKPITDNGKVLHHWILYAGMSMLTGWAPGDDEDQPYPANVGMDMPSTRNGLRLDMHYWNQGGTPAPDRSGVAVCVVKGAKLRPLSAAVMMGFTSFGPILAPANKRGHESTGTCRVTTTKPVHLMTASPHAHQYAKHMRFTVTRANGQKIVMHDGPFKFGEQGTYQLTPEVILNTGDTVTTTCIYDNPTSRNITFGESTNNEMCFNFAVYYPKGALSCGGAGGILGR